jgi:hypothetical protein
MRITSFVIAFSVFTPVHELSDLGYDFNNSFIKNNGVLITKREFADAKTNLSPLSTSYSR